MKMTKRHVTHHYLIHIQYLGFRYHGWQKQPGLKTIEAMIEKTLDFILPATAYKILGASRTDARVSANHSACMLFIDINLDLNQLEQELNANLPGDIRVTGIEQKDADFNIINTPKIKEYIYLFSYGQKNHPFSAALMTTFLGRLDIDQMKKGARLFEGRHPFIRYCTKPNPGKQLDREILSCEIKENNVYQASFFPENSWMLCLCSTGFLRYQIRLIMGQLVRLGRGEIQLSDIIESLEGSDKRPLPCIAPASGLILNKILFHA
jgi:tRNA pseudouridine38-40 synthase